MVQATTRTPSNKASMGLSDTQLAMYRRDGFLIVKRVFGSSFVTTVRDAFDRMHLKSQSLTETTDIADSLYVIGPPQPNSTFKNATLRVVWAGGDEPILETLGHHPRILAMASAVLASDTLMQLINQAHFKHPYDGVDFPWHQDSRHRRQGTELFTDLDGCGSFVETLTAIDPMTLDNGPLEVLVGSHKEGHLENFVDELPRLLQAYPSHTIEMEPGDVMLCSPFIVHQSLANTGQSSRYVFLNGFALPGASRRVYPGCGLGRLRQLSSNTV